MGVTTQADTQAARRIGVFGGAFDPPHAVHHALAAAAIDTLALDVLLIVPTGDAWHKSRPLSPARDRLAMCRLAFADLPKARVDDRELHRDGPTYTIDTLTELQQAWPAAQLYLQIGADQAAAFHTWRSAQAIADIAIISIAARADATGAAPQFDPATPLFCQRDVADRVLLSPPPRLSPSPTAVRRPGAQGLPIDHLVAPAVAGYIAENHLYQTA